MGRVALEHRPVVTDGEMFPVMFYNGATRAAQWRIGWVVFDRSFTRVVARCEHPIVLPGERCFAEDTDIAFAAFGDPRSIAFTYIIRPRIGT